MVPITSSLKWSRRRVLRDGNLPTTHERSCEVHTSDWIAALAVANQPARCSPICPWCEVEVASGVVLFNIAILLTADVDRFDDVTVCPEYSRSIQFNSIYIT